VLAVLAARTTRGQLLEAEPLTTTCSETVGITSFTVQSITSLTLCIHDLIKDSFLLRHTNMITTALNMGHSSSAGVAVLISFARDPMSSSISALSLTPTACQISTVRGMARRLIPRQDSRSGSLIYDHHRVRLAMQGILTLHLFDSSRTSNWSCLLAVAVGVQPDYTLMPTSPRRNNGSVQALFTGTGSQSSTS
jgi:hypothetical protein